MPDIIDYLLRQSPRYPVKSGEDLVITLSNGNGSSVSIHTELVDISAEGARLKSNMPISVNEHVTVHIDVAPMRQTIAASGEVCWVNPLAGNDWAIGCVFQPPIASKVIPELAVNGILERRERPRERVSLRATASCKLNCESTPVWVLNYSPGGGFCLLSQSAIRPEGRVLLQFDLEDEQSFIVQGKCRWSVESEEGFVTGCEFLHCRDSQRMCELLDASSAGAPTAGYPSPWSRPLSLSRFIDLGSRSRKQQACRLLACGIAGFSTGFMLSTVMLGNQAGSPSSQRFESDLGLVSVTSPDSPPHVLPAHRLAPPINDHRDTSKPRVSP